jgi:aryl-alcohol dehydrogenase-like predicted oxidoreductase
MLPQVHEPMIRMAKRFAFLHRPPSQTLAEAAYRYILGHPQVATVIGGFSDISHMADALAAVSAGPLSASDLARIELELDKGF